MKYRLEVKVRGAYPKPFTWEIYKDGKPLWVERSGDSYSSESEAREAGNVLPFCVGATEKIKIGDSGDK